MLFCAERIRGELCFLPSSACDGWKENTALTQCPVTTLLQDHVGIQFSAFHILTPAMVCSNELTCTSVWTAMARWVISGYICLASSVYRKPVLKEFFKKFFSGSNSENRSHKRAACCWNGPTEPGFVGPTRYNCCYYCCCAFYYLIFSNQEISHQNPDSQCLPRIRRYSKKLLAIQTLVVLWF